MTATETMARIYALLDKHAPKYMTPVNVGAIPSKKYDISRGKPLTEAQKKRAKILRAARFSYDDIAAEFGVSRSTVYRAVNGDCHGH